MGQTFVLVAYHSTHTDSDGVEQAYTPYSSMIHRADDTYVAQFPSEFAGVLAAAGVADGDEFELVAVKTGRRPFGDRKVRWVGAGEYAREPEPATTDAAPPDEASR